MFSNSIITIGLRGFQVLFATIVFGLSITLVRGHREGSLPTTLAFATAVGGLSLLASLLSVAASVADFLHGQIGMVVDSVVLLLNIAGGMLMAIKLKGVSCRHFTENWEDAVDMVRNDIICGGIGRSRESPWSCHYLAEGKYETLERRCRESTADAAFMFLTAIVLIAVGTWTYLRMKRGY